MPFVVTADDIDAALARTDAQAKAIDDGVKACPTLDPSARQQWNDFLAGYMLFSSQNKGHSFFALGLPNIGNQVIGYEHELNAWLGVIRQQCSNVIVPNLDPHDDAANRNDNFPSVDPTTKILIGGGIALLLLLAFRK